MTAPDGTETVVPAGVERVDPGSLVDTLFFLAYRAGPARVAGFHSLGDPLDATIRRAWSHGRPTAADFLGGGPGPKPEALPGWAADLLARPDVTRGARLGPLFVYRAVATAHRDLPECLAHARAWRDDLLETGPTGSVRLVRFADEAAAAAFAAAYGRPVEPRVDVGVRGDVVVATAGSPAFRAAFEERVGGR